MAFITHRQKLLYVTISGFCGLGANQYFRTSFRSIACVIILVLTNAPSNLYKSTITSFN